jgi:ubiquinone/menaquinone biosynthesis C-methylase UbiE
MISYDFQAGSYIKAAEKNYKYIDSYTDCINKELKELGIFESIMEVGVGEATIMSPLMQKNDPNNTLRKFGFDISWSRVRYAKEYSNSFQQKINFFNANLFEIPLPDNSIDIVYTSHSLEPNGGLEKEALKELHRVAGKYIILLEPDFENGSEEAKARMLKHGYVTNLKLHAEELGYEIVKHRPFDICINPLNPTGLTIIKKNETQIKEAQYVCPITKSILNKIRGNWYSNETGLLFPEIDEIPCLLEQNAILATHYLNF